jgi:hypothetical protein
MKLKNEIFSNGFTKALQELIGEKLPASQAFELRKLIKEVNDKATIYEEARIGLLKQFSKKDKEGNPMTKTVEGKELYDVEDMEGFSTELKALTQLEEDYNIQKIKLSDNIQISASNVAILEDILTIE